jgi:hypothetical protein
LSQKKTYPADVRFAIQCLVRVGGAVDEAIIPATNIEPGSPFTSVTALYGIGENILYRGKNHPEHPFCEAIVEMVTKFGDHIVSAEGYEVKKKPPVTPDSKSDSTVKVLSDMIVLARRLLDHDESMGLADNQTAEEQIKEAAGHLKKLLTEPE